MTTPRVLHGLAARVLRHDLPDLNEKTREVASCIIADSRRHIRVSATNLFNRQPAVDVQTYAEDGAHPFAAALGQVWGRSVCS